MNRFKVHIGYTDTGRNRWRTFADLNAANTFCEQVRRATQIVLTVIEVKPRARVRCIQTACRHCGLDIENMTPFKRQDWRDRGNNTHCRAGRLHAPVLE
jgi:hypothetical protein